MGNTSVSFQYTAKSEKFIVRTPQIEICDIREKHVGIVQDAIIRALGNGPGELRMVTHSSKTSCSVGAFNVSDKQWDEIFKSVKRKE